MAAVVAPAVLEEGLAVSVPAEVANSVEPVDQPVALPADCLAARVTAAEDPAAAVLLREVSVAPPEEEEELERGSVVAVDSQARAAPVDPRELASVAVADSLAPVAPEGLECPAAVAERRRPRIRF